MKAFVPLLAALTLLAPQARADVECDVQSDGQGGYQKTVAACNEQGSPDTCVTRLIPVLIKCQHKLNGDAGNEKESNDVKQRIATLMDFANNNPGIKKASLQLYAQQGGKPDPALVQLGLAQAPAAPVGTPGEEAPPPTRNSPLIGGGTGGSRNGTGQGQPPATKAGAAADLKSGNAADAERKLDRLLAENPDDAEALALRAQAREALGDREGARADALKALQLDPTNTSARLTAEQSAQLEKAAGVSKKFGKLAGGLLHGPDDAGAEGGTERGRVGVSNGDTEAARDPARSAAVPGADIPRGGSGDSTGLRSPTGLSPLMLTALRKQALGDYTGALIDVSQELDSNPNDAAALTLRAELDIQLGNYLAGISDADKALGLTPDSARALRARSYAEYETKLYRQALADATRAVALDPNNGLGYLYKALAEDKLGLSDDAAADLNRALALDPTLKRLAAPLLKKYKLRGEATDSTAFHLKPWMVRGGFVGTAMLLVLIGLLGTQKARTLKAIKLTPRRARADDEPITSGDLAPGRMLGGGYRVARELGRGGMGVVYEAFDERLRRTVAIKRLLRDELTTPEDTALFLREARIVAQLKHPNLAQIYDVADEKEPFLVFEYVDGEPLDRVLSRAVVLTPAAARPIVAQISAALTYAHGRGVVHRDLKPSNVMVTAAGAVKVMDFGIAHQSRGTATRLTQTVASGTPPYMAPEQAMGSVSKASDLYALGVMTYELLTGKRPFEGPDFLGPKLEKRFMPASRANPVLAAALDQFFASTLDPDPTRRPADAAAFMSAFGRACDATPRHPSAA